MTVRILLSVASVFLIVSPPTVLLAAKWHVDDSVAMSGDGTSWGSAFKMIQEGIDAASDGDTLTVAPGTYEESLDFSGKAIAMTSSDPSDRAIVAATVLTSKREGSVVTFNSGESVEAVLTGFTITEGNAEFGGGIFCGNGACPTIANCRIYGSIADRGGGIYCKDASPTIDGCDIYSNQGKSTGGGIELRDSDATITRCRIWANAAQGEAGILCSRGSPTISHCEIFGNETEWSDGGAIGCFEGTRVKVQACRIYGNSARSGGAIIVSGYSQETRPTVESCFIYRNYSQRWGNIHCEGDAFPVITNCTICGNESGDVWGGVYCGSGSPNPRIKNCILWHNERDLRDCSATYSDIESGGEGDGNICVPPLFANPEIGDFHLQPFSPCIKVGAPPGVPSEDIDGEYRAIDQNVDMGADEAYDMDLDGMPDYWEERFGFDPMDNGEMMDPRNGADGDPDDDGIPNIEEYLSGYHPLRPYGVTLHVSPDGDDAWDGSRRQWQGETLGPKRTIQAAVDDAFVGDTVLVEPGVYCESIVLIEKDIRIRARGGASRTTISGDGRCNAVILGLTGLDSSLECFTIRDGFSRHGAGIYCWNCMAMIRDCVVSENSAGLRGGGIYCSFGASPLITGCVIRSNEAGYHRGMNEGRGGGIACRHQASPKISGCIIASNRASREGDGIHCDWSSLRVVNCTLHDNSLYAEGSGGEVTIRNCIVWAGSASGDKVSCTYSCIQWMQSGEGNIDRDPLLVDPESGDFHLSSESPCIDMGTLSTGFIPATDMDGEERVFGLSVDMGADEFIDLDGNGLGDYWEKLYFGALGQDPDADPDRDGIVNRLEAKFRTVPTEVTTNRVINLAQLKDYVSIAVAISGASAGDEIMASPGTYRENLVFGGIPVVLRSSYPFEAACVAKTVIDGGNAGSVIRFEPGGKGATSEVCGFKITGGSAEKGGGVFCGNGTKPTLSNNVIVGNSANEGAGVYCEAYSSPKILNNVICRNSAASQGGGICSTGSPLVSSNTIAWNSAMEGGGVHGHPVATGPPTIINCILWENGDDLSLCSATYSCIQDTDPGQGNIAQHPHFVGPENGDYHLASWSPCIDAGDPASPFSNEPEPNGRRVNMGAYGNTPEAAQRSPDSDNDGLPDDWEKEVFGTLNVKPTDDADGDGIVNEDEFRYGWNPLTAAPQKITNANIGRWYAAIQPAILEASDGDRIVVHPGVYHENIRFVGRAITLSSLDPLDKETMQRTVLEGGDCGSVVTFDEGEDTSAILEGFTITGGEAKQGGGIMCTGSSPTIRRCLISGNRAEIGGGVRLGTSSAVIIKCVIRENSASHDGGGIAGWRGSGLRIVANTISDNWAGVSGGGIACTRGSSDCIAWNWVSGNSARSGGGIYTEYESLDWGMNPDMIPPSIFNNMVVKNSGTETGGGISCRNSPSIIVNNTILANTAARSGGGVYSSGSPLPMIKNCIVWGNGDDLFGCTPTFSCIEDGDVGEGNIHVDPRFLGYAVGEYHLSGDSPCIDAGSAEGTDIPTSDFDGEDRPQGSSVDIGADEYKDEDADNLPDYWEILHLATTAFLAEDDPDADGISNAEELAILTHPGEMDTDGDGQSDPDELFAGTDPRESTSAFRVLELSVEGAFLRMRWTTVPGRRYVVFASTDAMTWFQTSTVIAALQNFLESSSMIGFSKRGFFRIEVLP